MDHLLDPYASRNIGILVSYFTVGVVSRLTQTPVEYYLIDTLGASSQQYSAYKVKYTEGSSLNFTIFDMAFAFNTDIAQTSLVCKVYVWNAIR